MKVCLACSRNKKEGSVDEAKRKMEQEGRTRLVRSTQIVLKEAQNYVLNSFLKFVKAFFYLEK